jgi:alpha,alpha-trehalase
MVTIDVQQFEAFIFDLDGAITQTASIHARAWKQLFDEFLARQTAESSHHCAEILRAAGLTTLFDVRVNGTDIDRLGLSGKPDPDMFLEAARRLGAPPLHVVVFEDATAGIAAARAGGFGRVIGV